MKVYIKFLIYTFYKSFFYVTSIMLSLVFILNSPAMIFEMFPFIFLITTQLFFIKLFNNNELEIFKYSGLKNSSILTILSVVAIITGVLVTVVFYTLSSNLKNIYLEIKSQYTTDGKYLAVITKNGLWIKDKVDGKTFIINASKIQDNFLIDSFITEFDKDYNVVRNIRSKKIDLMQKNWKIYNAKIYENNNYKVEDILKINSNFDYERIQTLYSSLSSFNLIELFELRKNYKKMNSSLTEIELHLLKLILYPVFLLLMTIFSSMVMLRIKRLDSTTFKISLGLFCSVIIYYINNFFFVMGSTEKISAYQAVFIPLILLTIINSLMARQINDK